MEYFSHLLSSKKINTKIQTQKFESQPLCYFQIPTIHCNNNIFLLLLLFSMVKVHLVNLTYA